MKLAAEEDGVSICFSPRGGCTAPIVADEGATRSVYVQAYRLTSAPIAKALSDAHARGVQVIVLLDRAAASTTKYSDATYLAKQGMEVHVVDDDHAIAHNKVIIIDKATVVTGSFYFSKAAEEDNAENLLVIRGKPTLARAYIENYARHLDHARPYVPPAAGAPDAPARRASLCDVTGLGNHYLRDEVYRPDQLGHDFRIVVNGSPRPK